MAKKAAKKETTTTANLAYEAKLRLARNADVKATERQVEN